MTYGPTCPVADATHKEKYRQPNESFEESQERVAAALADDEAHRQVLKDIYLNQRFLNAGRIQSTVGSVRTSTPFNCFVSATIEDSLVSIMDRLKEAALTMQKGGGIGYDFSSLRHHGAPIVKLDTVASGPISFMDTYNSMCGTVMAAGWRRGAMMAVLRVDHPDIEAFIRKKQDQESLKNFNISVGITDKFMRAVVADTDFNLIFGGQVIKRVRARGLWEEIMRATWVWAEPGVLFLDTINRMNNLYYCEHIVATNPCAEQPLPPYGACLLGSFNLTKYVVMEFERCNAPYFDYHQFKKDIPPIVRAIDNVIDIADFPLPQQKLEAINKRRMGLGITGLGNVITALGHRYGDEGSVNLTRTILGMLRDTAYRTSAGLAHEKGAFPLYDKEKFANGAFYKTLPEFIKCDIDYCGLRNSHLISIAPAGTISFTADNVSSGIEPAFAHVTNRTVLKEDGAVVVQVKDYALSKWGIKGDTANDLSIQDHLAVLFAAYPYVDSAISKTINIGDDVTFDQFKNVYMEAWIFGAKGCTTHRRKGKKKGIMEAACFIDPNTGSKTCDE